jgi:hypothetical protein
MVLRKTEVRGRGLGAGENTNVSLQPPVPSPQPRYAFFQGVVRDEMNDSGEIVCCDVKKAG